MVTMSRSLDTGKFGKMVKSKVQGSEERLKTQTKTFRKWCNVHLPADELIPPGELIESLQDGTRLCMLVESLTGRKVKYRERARIKVKIHKMENISLALSKLTKAGVRLDDVEANMIFEGAEDLGEREGEEDRRGEANEECDSGDKCDERRGAEERCKGTPPWTLVEQKK